MTLALASQSLEKEIPPLPGMGMAALCTPTQSNTFPALTAASGIPWFVVHSPTAAAQKTETDLPLLHTYIWHGTPLLHYPQPGKTLVIDTK